MKKLNLYSFLIFLITSITNTDEIFGQVTVDVNVDVKHSVNGYESFDRKKWINVHSDNIDHDWDEEIDKMDYLMNDLDVYFGRETGSTKWELQRTDQDPKRYGYPDPDQMKKYGSEMRIWYSDTCSDRHSYEPRTDLLMSSQAKAYYPGSGSIGGKWRLFRGEPFGKATGEFVGRYLANYFEGDGVSGRPMPSYYEVLNEPMWGLIDNVSERRRAPIQQIFNFHNQVAEEIKKYVPDMKVGGFAPAFPEVEKGGFQQWEERWKYFIDSCGPNMDFYSIHFYDFPGIYNGQRWYRKGANIEATLDMIEHYSRLKEQDRPFIISEYGGQLNDWYNQPWSAFRDWLCIKSFNGMMMQFMERPDKVLKAIPFTLVKAEWGRKSPETPYYWRLMRQKDEPKSPSGDWVWTEQIKFYQLWQDVNGIRIDSKSSDPNIQVDAYASGKKAYLIINSMYLDKSEQVRLDLLGLGKNRVKKIRIRKLFLSADSIPVLENKSYKKKLDSLVTVEPEATLVVEYALKKPLDISHLSEETKYYAESYKQPIIENEPIRFVIKEIDKNEQGEAILRIGVGRYHKTSLLPVVKFNDVVLKTEVKYKGDDQRDKISFFGLLEVEVPYELVQETNQIDITFPDTGGHVSSLALQMFNFSRPIPRFQRAK